MAAAPEKKTVLPLWELKKKTVILRDSSMGGDRKIECHTRCCFEGLRPGIFFIVKNRFFVRIPSMSASE
jgi:hypothetical protein